MTPIEAARQAIELHTKPTLAEKMARAIRAEVERQGRLVGYVSSDEEMARAALAVVLEEMREPSRLRIIASDIADGFDNLDTNQVVLIHLAMLAQFEKEQAGG